MTPADAVAAIERLVALSGRLTDATAMGFSAAQYVPAYRHPTAPGVGGWVVPVDRWDSFAEAFGETAAATSAARPALSALAGMCVLDVETVQMLLDAATDFDLRLASDSPARAAAEAELRRVDGCDG